MSTSISPLLQITAPEQQSKSNPTVDGSGNDFQNLLAEASDSAKKSTEDSQDALPTSSTKALPEENTQHDATSDSEHQDVHSDATGANDEPTEQDDQSQTDDSLELSEAAAILQHLSSDEETVTFQVAATGTFEAEVLHVTATETSPDAQIASPLLSSEREGEVYTAQQTETALQTGLGEFAEVTSAANTDGLASESAATSKTQEITQIDDGAFQADANNQERGTQPQPSTTIEEGTETSAQAEQNKVDPSQPIKQPAKPEHTSRDTEPNSNTAINRSETAESATTLQHPVEQTTQVEIVTAKADASAPAEHSANQIESSAVNATEAPSNTRTEATTSSTTEAEPVPTADRVRFVQRVSRAFQSAKSSAGEIQLKLSPPELGTLKLSISVEQGVVSAKVETETAAARNILLDNLPALRERLAEQEIRIEKFDVDVGQDGEQNDQQSRFDENDRQHNHLSQQNSGNTAQGTSGSQNTAEEPAPAQAQVLSSDSLDVSI